jgi:hypothetical protein
VAFPVRALVAARQPAWQRLEQILTPLMHVVPVHTPADAYYALDHESFDVIITTIAFDDSRMIDFLQAVKRKPVIGAIPFVGCRVLQSVLRDSLVATTAEVCVQCGAVAFVDVARLDDEKATTTFIELLEAYVVRE